MCRRTAEPARLHRRLADATDEMDIDSCDVENFEFMCTPRISGWNSLEPMSLKDFRALLGSGRLSSAFQLLESGKDMRAVFDIDRLVADQTELASERDSLVDSLVCDLENFYSGATYNILDSSGYSPGKGFKVSLHAYVDVITDTATNKRRALAFKTPGVDTSIYASRHLLRLVGTCKGAGPNGFDDRVLRPLPGYSQDPVDYIASFVRPAWPRDVAQSQHGSSSSSSSVPVDTSCASPGQVFSLAETFRIVGSLAEHCSDNYDHWYRVAFALVRNYKALLAAGEDFQAGVVKSIFFTFSACSPKFEMHAVNDKWESVLRDEGNSEHPLNLLSLQKWTAKYRHAAVLRLEEMVSKVIAL